MDLSSNSAGRGSLVLYTPEDHLPAMLAGPIEDDLPTNASPVGWSHIALIEDNLPTRASPVGRSHSALVEDNLPTKASPVGWSHIALKDSSVGWSHFALNLPTKVLLAGPTVCPLF